MPDALNMTISRYSKTAMVLHWGLALALLFQIGLGWQFETLERGPNMFALYQLHKSVGIAILILSLARLAIRIARPRPQPMADTAWSRLIASIVHGGFYLVLIGGPLTGWLLVSSAKVKVPTLLFGYLPLPHLPVGPSAHAPAETLHAQLAWLAIVLLLLHVAGALRHQFFKDEDLLQRMLPLKLERKLTAAIATVTVVAGLGVAYASGTTLSLADAKPAAPSIVPSPAPEVASTVRAQPEAEETPEEVKEPDAAEPVKNWRVSKGGRLAFTVDWNGTPINGTFGRWSSSIRFSPDDLGNSNVQVTVDLGSASTADSQRDEMLLGESFLNVTAHPKAVFSSSEIQLVRGDNYRARGTLKLHGETHPVTLNFKLKIDGATAKVNGTSKLRRTQFGVGSGEWSATGEVADTVAIAFDFSAQSAP
jgi:cytochrome b561/polyisoprenoid-binding protein YceI